MISQHKMSRSYERKLLNKWITLGCMDERVFIEATIILVHPIRLFRFVDLEKNPKTPEPSKRIYSLGGSKYGKCSILVGPMVTVWTTDQYHMYCR